MTREALVSELIDTFKDVINFVDMNEEKAKEIFTKNQLDLVDEIWGYYDDFKEATIDELEEWNEHLEEMHYMY